MPDAYEQKVRQLEQLRAVLAQQEQQIRTLQQQPDLGMSVDPQTVASAQTQAYHEQFTPQGFVPPQQGTEMFPAASTAVATMPPEEAPEFIPPGESFLGNLAKGIPRFAGTQVMFAEEAIKDPIAGLKGLAEFGVGAVEKASYLGVPSKFQHIAAGEREKQLTEEFLNYPFEYFLQVTAPFFIGMGGAKLVARAKTIYGQLKKGKSFKEATTIGMKAAGIKSPESAMAKWDAELTRQFEQRPKPKPQEAPDALQRQKAADQKATAKAEEVAPKQPWEMTESERVYNKALEKARRQDKAEADGQAILDGLESADVNVNKLHQTFWKDVHPKLPQHTQVRFQKWVQSRTGEGLRTGETWSEVALRFIELPDDVGRLTGGERGYVSMMAEAMRRVERGDFTKPVPAEVLAEYPELGKGKAVSQNFTQFAIEKKLATDYDITDHGGLSPSGKRTKIGEKRRAESTLKRIQENEQAHKLYKEAIERGEVVDPSGEVTKKGLQDTAIKRQREKAESRISIIDTKIKDIENLGAMSHMKNGKLRKNFQSQVDNLLIEKRELQIKIGGEPTKLAQPPKPTKTLTKTKGKPVDLEASRFEEVAPVEMAQKYEKPAPSPEPVGLKKTEIEQIRRNTGLDQLEAVERRGWEEVLHRAKREKVDEIISPDEVIKSGRQISDVEHAGMVVKAAKLADQYDVSIKTVNELVKKGDVAAAKLESSRSESIITQMDRLTEASDIGGREAARALSIRRMMVNRETYDLAHIVQRAQAAKGEKLTSAERGKFEQMTAEHTRLQEKLKKVEVNYDKLVAERELMTAEKVAATERKKAKIEQRKVVLREKIQTERADIKKQLTAMGYRVNDVTGVTAEGSYLVGRLAVNYIKDGAVSLDAVVKQVLTDLPQLTKRDVYQSLITKDPKVQAKARVETMKRVGQLKTQARLLLEIEKVEKGVFEPTTPGQKATQPVAIRQLQKKLRDLRATAYKSNMSAARLEKAIKTINELQDQLANNYRSIKKGKPELTPDLSVAREKIKDLRKTMHVQDELTKTQDRLRTGNFDIKVKPVEKPILPELERAQILLKVNRKRIRQSIKEMEPMTIKKAGVEAINTARTLKATADMSAKLRQGLVPTISLLRSGQFRTVARTYKKSFKSFFDKYTAEQIDNAIKSAPNHYLREKAGLQLMEVGGRVARGEEMFMSSVAEKVPLYGKVVKASEQHMVTHLNMLRTAMFDHFLEKFPNATHAELKAWADFVNKASGRGNLGKFAGAANTLSLAFFAPRFAISRVQTPLALFKRGISRRVRKEIAKDMVATASVGATALTLAHLAGAEVGTDPRNADWGKIKIGNSRVDIWGGMQQPMRVVARIGLGVTDKWGWTGKELTGWQKDVDPTELAARFSQYKFSPLATIPLELYKGKTIVGEDVTPSETAVKAMIPMVYEDMRDAWRLEGLGHAAWVGGLAFFGVGASTYSRKESTENSIRKLLEDARKATSRAERKKKETSAKAAQTRWNNLNPKDRISILR